MQQINDSQYWEIVDEIITNPEFLKLKDFWHHNSSIFEHCVNVSYASYQFGKKHHLDYVSLARGGLLHDFFLYNWREDRFQKWGNFKNSHAFRHPHIALENAERLFSLNDMERDIIVKHMWPITLSPPKYKESLVVAWIDTYMANKEYAYLQKLKENIKSAYQMVRQRAYGTR